MEQAIVENISSQIDFSERKRILVAGADSCIGKSFACFMQRWPDVYQTDMISIMDDSWKKFDYSGYDAVLYAAGNDFRKAGNWMAVRIADKAKRAGAGMFLYLSSLHVYGMYTDIITKTAPVHPADICGRLQLETEKALWKLNSREFCVAVLRLPLVYGYGCKGNYHIAARAAKSGVFPEFGRKCSVIHINNLSSAVRGIIHYGKAGTYFPQDPEYVDIYKMAEEVSRFYGKKIRSIKLLNPVLALLSKKAGPVREIFYGYLCDQNLNVPKEWLAVKDIRKGIRQAESGW